MKLIYKNDDNNYCVFEYEDWDNEKKDLPTSLSAGNNTLKDISSCCIGSIVNGINDSYPKYILNKNNEWMLFHPSNKVVSLFKYIDISNLLEDLY